MSNLLNLLVLSLNQLFDIPNILFSCSFVSLDNNLITEVDNLSGEFVAYLQTVFKALNGVARVNHVDTFVNTFILKLAESKADLLGVGCRNRLRLLVVNLQEELEDRPGRSSSLPAQEGNAGNQ